MTVRSSALTAAVSSLTLPSESIYLREKDDKKDEKVREKVTEKFEKKESEKVPKRI